MIDAFFQTPSSLVFHCQWPSFSKRVFPEITFLTSHACAVVKTENGFCGRDLREAEVQG